MKQIMTIAYYEAIHILKDKVLLLVVFIAPVLYAALFGMIYISGTLQHVPLGIVDLDHSTESRAVVSSFENTDNFKIISGVTSYEDLEKGMKNGTVRAGVVIPKDYSQKLSQHQLTQISTVYDGSNLIYGYNTRRYFITMLNTFSAEHTASYLAGLGMTKREITDVMDTVSYSMQVWYNPTYSYPTFIFIGMVVMILHQLGFLCIALTVTREKEKNTWIQFLCSAIPQWKIFIGKALPYFIAGFFNFSLLLWVAVRFINVKFSGSLVLILLLGLLFNIIITSSGFVVSLYAPNSLQVTRYLMLMSVPLFVISGYTWPGAYIPKLLNGLARLMPYTWMAEGIRYVTVKNLGVDYLVTIISVLALMAGGSSFLALTFSKRRKPFAQDRPTVNSTSLIPKKGF
ncbi:MAG: ABC transporter permease [Eubacteriales bacterium]